MRYIGAQAKGLRMPIINPGDPLAELVAVQLAAASAAEGTELKPDDIIAVTEAVVGKAQKNYVKIDDIAEDIKQKYPGGTVGVVFPIMSRNRFLNILKGITAGAKKVYVLLAFPADEQGNPLADMELYDDIADAMPPGPVPADVYKKLAGTYLHPFTGVDYIELYESAGASVYVSSNPRDILKLTPHVLAADIQNRFITQKRLLKAGAKTVYTLSDVMSASVNGSGFNEKYGVLGSNLATDDTLKLFPRECEAFIYELQDKIFGKTGVRPEVMVYGDGAYKDPERGIWEFADPVVSPAFTERLGGMPNEIKIKMVADQYLADLKGEAKSEAVREMIRQKSDDNPYNEGTTPRKFFNLLGSLCDLVSGSGDKGTPVVWVRGYFDNYATE